MPAGVWQGSMLEPGVEFALLGATMAPGFDYADYEQGRRTVLARLYPDHAELIRPVDASRLSGRSISDQPSVDSGTVDSSLQPATLAVDLRRQLELMYGPASARPPRRPPEGQARPAQAQPGQPGPRVKEPEQGVELVGRQERQVGRDHGLAETRYVEDRLEPHVQHEARQDRPPPRRLEPEPERQRKLDTGSPPASSR